ncbi:DUF2750 domain-containing protein [Chryseomicrobium sp. FSL W7-1435]|uniref:DUF2750 domain-containing protein n=1 Tax=Chryseomicrobium sp. FSL W7-1435 TaxID=2921704 RepID=UPI00315A4FC2
MKKELHELTRLPADTRYEVFLHTVVENKEVWGLFQEGWATAEDAKGAQRIFFWPSEEFASHQAAKEWPGFTPKPIALDEFIEAWLPGLEKDEIQISVFSTAKDEILAEAETLLEDLEDLEGEA